MIKSLLEYFEETVKNSPQKVAVLDGNRRLTFAGLESRAKEVAAYLCRYLKQQFCKPIAVFLPKSIESITADLAIIYSGNAYMNLDIKTPAQRISNILELVQPLCVITDQAHSKQLAAVWPAEKTVFLDVDFPDETGGDTNLLLSVQEKIIDTDPLCLINTSGSTGTPKSVVLNHRSFIDYTTWAIETLHLRAEEILGSIAPIVFDHFSYEFCLMLMHSCTLLLVPESYTIFPVKLLELLNEYKATYLFWVPTLMVNIANMNILSRIPLPNVSMVWFAGEVFPTKQFNYWRSHLPQATFVNLYGPTEITVDCTYYIVDRELREDEPIPIGYPCRNTDVLILNKENRPAAAGEEGELCVRGSSLAMGYYNNPEKTKAAFVQNPLNQAYPELIYRTGDIVYVNDLGEIIFKGRNDTLIKHHGKRIELGEIEHIIINTLQLVKNGCAVYNREKQEIVFFYEAAAQLENAALRKEIGAALPKYMIPGKFVFMEELPRNTNGKIDRLKLSRNL
ncbi:amino acid adenylation domain-containing protein [Acutalibacter caecimuris]|uniref:amino acid adenylation domain-containing protein n=1 Tax=Acutalibacter caecimuris TaxID=3093657 RepID=UPI002AC8CFB1|nr:amino acid adenylation domain-containing protein [Acutalibacter sp. M00118]